MTVTSRRRLLLLMFGSAAAVLVWIGADLWAGRRLDRDYARLEKRFGSLDGRSQIAARVPAEDNSARFVRAAVDLTVLEWSYGALLASVRGFEASPSSAPVPADIKSFLDANADAIRMAGEARSRHQASWEADYGVGGGGYQPSLLKIRSLGNAMYFAALVDMKAARDDEAARKIAAGLAVSASLRNEPALLSQLIRIAVAMHECEGVKQLLERSEPSAAALAELARSLEENRRPDPMQVGLRAELRWTAWYLNERSDPSLLHWIGRPFGRELRRWKLLDIERLLDELSGPRPRSSSPVFSWWDPRRSAASMTAGLNRAIDSDDTHSSVLAVSQVGVALRRYRLDRGAYPDDLAALVPAYLGRLPIDLTTGKPPVYARSGAGFTLKAERVTKDPMPSPPLELRVER